MSVNTKINGQLVKSAGLYAVTIPIGMADIYSTEEKEVGLWIDNRPLYQKTINFGALPNATLKSVAHGIANIGVCNIVNAFSKNSSNTIVPLPYATSTAQDQMQLYVDATNVNIRTASNASTFSDTYIVLQYTKTTDTPWSGFVPQGYGYVSSGDIFSEEERQIGVYIDGKPLYQKTIDCGALPANTTKTVAHNVSNMDNIVELKGVTYSTTNGYTLPLEDLDADVGVSSTIRLYANATNIYIKTKTDQSVYDETYVTIKYTKTTDVAGSGEYVPSGDKAVHYSESEQVIGTWIDGSTLYARTFVYTNTGLSAGTNALITLDSNIRVKTVRASIFSSNDSRCYVIPYVGNSGSTSVLINNENKITLQINNDSWSSTYTPIIFYVEYTKSSS